MMNARRDAREERQAGQGEVPVVGISRDRVRDLKLEA
jgi:hypothetical protein